MESSKLKFSADKIDIIIIGTHQRNKIVDYCPVQLHGNDTPPSDTARDLSVFVDNDFCIHQYI